MKLERATQELPLQPQRSEPSPRAPFLTALGLTFTMHTMALRANSTIPITQTITIDGVEVYTHT